METNMETTDRIIDLFLKNNMLDYFIKDGEMYYMMKEEYKNKTDEEIQELLENLK